MGRLWFALFVVDVLLAAAALISCLSTEENDIRVLPRVGWILLILFFPTVGAIAWFVAGRERRQTPASGWRSGDGFPEHGRARPSRPARPVAPDDDPEFLRGIAAGNAEDRELMRRWEEDLKRREEELRRREDTDS